MTEIGPVDIEVPRDRESSFAPVTVPKRARRLRGGGRDGGLAGGAGDDDR